MILLAKICHTMTLIVILMYFQTLQQIIPQEIILKTSNKHAILSQNLLIFFQLFFTDEVLRTIAQHTNSCARINTAKIQTYCDTGGAWRETDSKEIKTFIGLLLYQGFICAN